MLQSPLPPAPFDALVANDTVLAWVQVDLTASGRFGEGVLVLTPDHLIRILAGDAVGKKVLHRSPLDAVHPPILIERKGYVVLVQPPENLELARASPDSLRPLTAFTEAVTLFLKEGKVSAGPAPETEICPQCQGVKAGGRCPVCLHRNRILMRLLSEVAPFQTDVALAGILVLSATALGIAPPYLVKILVDKLMRPGAAPSSLIGVVVAMLILLLLQQIVIYARAIVGSRLKGEVCHRLRTNAFQALSRFSLPEVNQAQPSGLAQTILTDCRQISEFLVSSALTGLFSLAMIVGILGVLIRISPVMAIVVISPAPIFYYLARKSSYMGQLLVVRSRVESSVLSNRVWNFVQGFRVAKAFAAESLLSENFVRESGTQRDWEFLSDVHQSRIGPTLSLVSGTCSFLTWGYGGAMVLRGQLGVGGLVAYVTYLNVLYSQAQSITALIATMPRYWAACQHYVDMVDTIPAVRSVQRPVRLERWVGTIRFDGVFFSYVPGRDVLRDINLSIAPGEMIGLVGRSGSGKSTLINLIARLYDPTRGRISLDRVPLTQIDLAEWRLHVGLVLQTPRLFDGTVLENIRLGRPAATVREVCEAADRAQAHDFILALPDGYDTRLTAESQLSAGELQRLTIARAILRNPTLLILDEATASVDTQTEMHIQEAMAELIHGRTAIVIAHRLATLGRADRLIVLDNGQMVNFDTHAALIEKPGVYRDLVHAQTELSRERLMQSPVAETGNRAGR